MRRNGARALQCVVVGIVLSLGSHAHADRIDDTQNTIFRFEAGFHLGALGRVQGEVPLAFGDDRSLKPSPGLYLRADVALGRFFLFRPSVQWRSVKGEGVGGPHDLFSVQIGIGFRYEFELSEDGVMLEPYLFLMAGVDAVDRELIADIVSNENISFGPSWGARLGLVTWVSPRVGVVTAMGFERSDFFPGIEGIGRRHVHITQMAIDIGVTFRLH